MGFLSLFTESATAKDPVCGVSVQKEGASTGQFIGQTYYFCSERCRERFQALPTRFVEMPIKLTDTSSSGGACC
jgi:YHS domain-containing protein